MLAKLKIRSASLFINPGLSWNAMLIVELDLMTDVDTYQSIEKRHARWSKFYRTKLW